MQHPPLARGILHYWITRPTWQKVSALVLLNVLCILPMLGFRYPSVDQAERLYHLQEFLQGMVPYRDFFCHHFVGYLLPFALVSLVAPLTPSVMWLLCITYQLACAFINGQLCALLTGNRAAFWLAALLTASAGWLWNFGGHTFNNQSYFLPLLCLLLYCGTRGLLHGCTRSIQAVAFLSGILLLFDIRLLTLTPLVAYLGWHLAWSTRSRSSVLIFLALAAAAPLCGLVYLSYNDALLPFFYQTVYYPLMIKSRGIEARHWEAGGRLVSWIARGEPLLCLGALLGLITFIRHETRAPVRIATLLTLAGLLLYTVAAGRDRPNYLLVLAPLLVLGASYFIVHCWHNASRGSQFIACSFILLLIGGPVLRPLYITAKTGSPFLLEDRRLVTEVRTLLDQTPHPDPRVLVIGHCPSIYLESARMAPFGDVSLVTLAGANFHSIDSRASIPTPYYQRSLRALLQNPPTYVVVCEATGQPCEPTSPYCKVAFMDASKTFPMQNLNLERAPALAPLASLLQRDYTLLQENNFERDRYQLFSHRELHRE